MVHFPVHLANKVRLGGPVQYRWMYPIERCLCKIKSYVHNKAHPEASIVVGYLEEEALSSRYLHKSVETRLNKKGQNDDVSGSCGVDSLDYLPNIG